MRFESLRGSGTDRDSAVLYVALGLREAQLGFDPRKLYGDSDRFIDQGDGGLKAVSYWVHSVHHRPNIDPI
jgi:hypothetical protein